MENKPQVLTTPEIKRGGFFGNIINAFVSLGKGMKITFHYFSHPSTVVTQQYPENRETLKMVDRFRAQLTMPHDANGYHKCTGCGICDQNCPNGSIVVLDRKNPITGKKEIDRHIWRMDSCTFCNICVQVCPFDALAMSGTFESSVFDRRLLVTTLNEYAGPPANVLAKVENPEDRKKHLESRDRYGGPVPLSGESMAGIDAGIFKQLKAAAPATDSGAATPSSSEGKTS